MNETLYTADGRAMLRMERRLAHPPAKVWRALTEPAELSQWFPATVAMAPEVGAEVGAEVSFDLGDGTGQPGRITEFSPTRVFEFSWNEDLLRWELRPEAGGCLLIFTHTFDDRAGAASFAAGWQVCFDAMEMLLDGREVEHAHPPAELHDSYLEAFGLDAGVEEGAADGWQVRFERQLTRPADTVWATLTGSSPAVGTGPPAAFTAGPGKPGAVTALAAPALLEYEWLYQDRPAGRVRWELSDEQGTGHGARLVLTQTGPVELSDERSTALSAWRQHLRGLATQLR